MGICKRYVCDDTLAGNVLTDAFITIYGEIKTFKGDSSFEGWMRRIVINTAIDRIKRKDDNTLKGYGDIECEDYNISIPFDKLSANELLLMICDLPQGPRTVFNMFAIDGFSHKEISERLNIPEGTSQWYVNKARKLLQEKLKKYESDTGI